MLREGGRLAQIKDRFAGFPKCHYPRQMHGLRGSIARGVEYVDLNTGPQGKDKDDHTGRGNRFSSKLPRH